MSKKADIERNDYIDMRDDAYEARQLAQWLNELKYLREKIEQLTIQPEPKKEHWILYDKRFPWRVWYKCSECGNYLDFSGVNGGRGEANFCPNCGAKMKIRQNG